ncbi:MAG: mutY [Acidimicrobiia bacterium]|nr:mutY [Acidimicrobiia bacterium]
MRSDALLQWAELARRDLPWRHTRDPWAVLVSEIMSQQTQVARVAPKYEAFLDRFPTPSACAAAPLGEVLRLWHGLGYPRRARALHGAAAVLAADGYPATVEGWMALPGVGAYTARAVLAFAFERDVGVVDTNSARVLARWEGRRLSPAEAQAAADAAVPAGAGWAWNHGMLDLGSTICRPGAPDCGGCPTARWCGWAGRGPDPAIGTAGASGRQGRFEGSDRQARGRLMKALTAAPLPIDQLGPIMGCDQVRAVRLAESLASEGLIRRRGEGLELP